MVIIINFHLFLTFKNQKHMNICGILYSNEDEIVQNVTGRWRKRECMYQKYTKHYFDEI